MFGRKKATSSRRGSGGKSSGSGAGAGSGRRRRDDGPSVDTAKIEAIFEGLADPDEEEPAITAAGLVSICESVGIDPSTDAEILLIAYKFGAETGMRWSKDEFVGGMAKLGCESLDQLKAKLPRLRSEIMSDMRSAEFRDFYKFVFLVTREGKQKTIPKESMIALLPIVLPDSPHREAFAAFLEASEETKRVSMDQWNQFLALSNTVGADLAGYDDSSAWPVLFDEYADWAAEQKNNKK